MNEFSSLEFDLIEFQQRARVIACPNRLFALWEDVSRRYERSEIGKYELVEMKDLIFPILQRLGFLKTQINGEPDNINSDDSDFISASNDDETGASGS